MWSEDVALCDDRQMAHQRIAHQERIFRASDTNRHGACFDRRIIVAIRIHTVADVNDLSHINTESLGELSDGVRLIHTAQRDVNAGRPAGTHRQIGDISADRLGEPVLFLIRRISRFLDVKRSKLAESGERDLTAAILDAFAPYTRLPNPLLLRVAFQ